MSAAQCIQTSSALLVLFPGQTLAITRPEWSHPSFFVWPNFYRGSEILRQRQREGEQGSTSRGRVCWGCFWSYEMWVFQGKCTSHHQALLHRDRDLDLDLDRSCCEVWRQRETISQSICVSLQGEGRKHCTRMAFGVSSCWVPQSWFTGLIDILFVSTFFLHLNIH